MMSTAHGAALMPVPALILLCSGDAPAREITALGSLALALAAVGVHTAAMIAVTGVIAGGICRGFDASVGLLGHFARKATCAPRWRRYFVELPKSSCRRPSGSCCPNRQSRPAGQPLTWLELAAKGIDGVQKVDRRPADEDEQR